jgi:DNA primase
LRDPPDRWTLSSVPRRLARVSRDPWARYWTSAQEISDVSMAAIAQATR